MAIAFYRWIPDTCGCDIHYIYDDTDNPDHDNDTVHLGAYLGSSGYIEKTTLCAAHRYLTDPAAIRQVVHIGEHIRKNIAHRILMEAHSHLILASSVPGEGLTPHPNYPLRFFYDFDRKLHIDGVGLGLGVDEIAARQADFDTEFGANKVVIE